jgi:uncharacterized protein (TIGR03066 family)
MRSTPRGLKAARPLLLPDESPQFLVADQSASPILPLDQSLSSTPTPKGRVVKSPCPSTNQPKDVQSPGATPSSSPGRAVGKARRLPPRLKSLLLGLVCAALSALATFAAFEVFSPARLPVAMRGKWVVVEGEGLKGATMEFFADGRMVGTVQNPEKEVAIKGRVQVEGNRFRVTTTGPRGGVEVTDLEEILDLTDRRFVVQDARGEVLIMERASPANASKGGGAK